MYRFRINAFSTSPEKEIPLDDMVVVIGPNNAGKSQLLKDLLASATERNSKRTIVDSIEVETPTDLAEFLKTYPIQELRHGHGLVLSALGASMTSGWKSQERDSKWKDDFKHKVMKDKQREKEYFTYFLGSRVVGYSSTEHRLALSKVSKGITATDERRDLYAAMYYAGPEGETRFRNEFESVFGVIIRFDYSSPGRFRFRIGPDADDVPIDPREALRHYVDKKVPVLDEQGDGVRAFAGILMAFMVSEKPVLLIDEPELFLHPLLARKLGNYIGRNAGAAESRQVIVTTHDAEMLTGIVAENQHSQVIRVDRDGDTNSFTIVDGNRIAELSNDTILGKERVLEGLFHEAVVLTEGDADAKLLRLYVSRFAANQDIHVVDTNGKRGISKCLEFFQDANVPVLSILDFDVFNDRPTLIKLLDAARVKGADHDLLLDFQMAVEKEIKSKPIGERIASLSTLTGDLFGKLQKNSLPGADKDEILREARELGHEIRQKASEWHEVKERGCQALSKGLQDKYGACEEVLLRHRILVWRTGQLESILKKHGVEESSKKAWLRKALAFLEVAEMNVVQKKYPFLQLNEALGNLRG